MVHPQLSENSLISLEHGASDVSHASSCALACVFHVDLGLVVWREKSFVQVLNVEVFVS